MSRMVVVGIVVGSWMIVEIGMQRRVLLGKEVAVVAVAVAVGIGDVDIPTCWSRRTTWST